MNAGNGYWDKSVSECTALLSTAGSIHATGNSSPRLGTCWHPVHRGHTPGIKSNANMKIKHPNRWQCSEITSIHGNMPGKMAVRQFGIHRFCQITCLRCDHGLWAVNRHLNTCQRYERGSGFSLKQTTLARCPMPFLPSAPATLTGLFLFAHCTHNVYFHVTKDGERKR